ncbi:MAG: protein-export chaperone SecB [Polaromonas sp.]|nr:protein-export chaperone SecB [Polaromonas sp.]
MNSPRPPSLTITPTGVSSTPVPADNIAKAQYRIIRIYLKGASTEVPDMASVPRQAISPHVGVDMQTLANPAGPGTLECVLRIALHARLEAKTIFVVEVSVAGMFELDISNMEDAQRFVRKIAPSVLFPFARRDLASLTVAAGFQPVLLDHIDFDAMLAQVITSQRLTRKPAPIPMRLDVIAAKPATPSSAPAFPTIARGSPVVPPEVKTAGQKPAPDADSADWADTQPFPESAVITQAITGVGQTERMGTKAGASGLPTALNALHTPQTDMPPTGRVDPQALQIAPRRRARQAVLALLGLATLGATIAWWTQRPPPTPVAMGETRAKVVAPAASTAPTVTAPIAITSAPAVAVKTPVTPAETQRALETSRSRLADQPANWFTLDMGTAPIESTLATLVPDLTPLADRPVFVVNGKDNALRFLYGVFPSKAAADIVQSQLQQAESMKGRTTGVVVSISSVL